MKFFVYIIILIFNVNLVYADATESELILKELNSLITQQLWNDYDITSSEIISKKEYRYSDINKELVDSTGRVEFLKIKAKFSATRNKNTSIVKNSQGEITFTLNQDLYKKPDSCTGNVRHLYLHCGVKEGHIFSGDLEFLVVKTTKGLAILCSNCTRLSSYRLDGYLILGDREKEGYVWPPKDL